MLVSIAKEGNPKIVRLFDRIDSSNSDKYKSELEVLVVEKQKIILDLEKLDFIDSSGLGVLVTFLKRVVDLGGDIVITNLNYKTRLVFEITRANNLFHIYDSVEHALDSVA